MRIPGIHKTSTSQRAARMGSVLLEVVLALALFVGAATVISSGLNASVQAVYRLRQSTHAINLAISVLSEMQMHARPIDAGGPEPFPAPFDQWTWKIEVTQPETGPTEGEAMRRVEVIVRHTEDGVVQRLTQFIRADDVPPDRNESILSNGPLF